MATRASSFLLFFLCVSGVFAGSSLVSQESSFGRSQTAIHTYKIRKISSHRLGYRVDVVDYKGNLKRVYLKLGWFTDPDLRNRESESFELHCKMIYVTPSSHIAENSMAVTYEEGYPAKLVVYAERPNLNDINGIWGAVSPNENIDDQFNITTISFTDQ